MSVMRTLYGLGFGDAGETALPPITITGDAPNPTDAELQSEIASATAAPGTPDNPIRLDPLVVDVGTGAISGGMLLAAAAAAAFLFWPKKGGAKHGRRRARAVHSYRARRRHA